MRLKRNPRSDLAQNRLNYNQAPDDYKEAHNFNKRGLFIGGCPKSGTTLLMSLLDNHPQLIVLPEETHYLEERRQYLKLNKYQDRLELLLQKLGPLASPTGVCDTYPGCAPDVRNYAKFDYGHFSELARDLINKPWMNDSLLFSETIRAYGITLGAHTDQCVRWVEKTPATETHGDLFDELFPEAKLVQIVRDPRAVFASLKSRAVNTFQSYSGAHRITREWNKSAREIPRLRKDPSRFLVVRYEDLVNDPRDVLQRICRFGGFGFSESMLEPTRAGNDWLGNSAFYSAFSRISAAPADHWKNCLTKSEIAWVELLCHTGMEIAGYSQLTGGRFFPGRWLCRMPNESFKGYLRARRDSLRQALGLLKECRFDGR